MRKKRGLTGKGLLIVLPHGNEVPQAGIELLHDGLKEKTQDIREKAISLINSAGSRAGKIDFNLVLFILSRTFCLCYLLSNIHKPEASDKSDHGVYLDFNANRVGSEEHHMMDRMDNYDRYRKHTVDPSD